MLSVESVCLVSIMTSIGIVKTLLVSFKTRQTNLSASLSFNIKKENQTLSPQIHFSVYYLLDYIVTI